MRPPDRPEEPEPQRLVPTDPAAPPGASFSIAAAAFSGPIPPPAILERYEALSPGATERIIARWEKQSDHRMNREREVIRGDQWRSSLGLGFAFVLALIISYGCYLLIMAGHEIPGSILGGGGLATLVGLFIQGQRQRTAERREKEQVRTALRDAGMTEPAKPRKPKRQ